jgi:hypothetical protein
VAASWRYLDGAGYEVGRSPSFPDRDAAEAWLRGAWEELLGSGVAEVELEEDGGVTYRMGLEPA